MTTFLRLLTDKDKASNLLDSCTALRAGETDTRVFDVEPESFRAVPGAPFAYWVSEAVRQVFKRLPAFECDDRTARQGLATAEDFRFVRTWWEQPGDGWHGFAKGGTFSPFYADVYLMTNWDKDGAEVKAGICRRYPYLNGNAEFVAKNPQFYLRPGITWPRRTNGLSFRAMPRGCIFADKGPAAFVDDDEPDALLALCTVVNSLAFGLLVSVQLARVELAQSFEVGLIQQTPLPDLSTEQKARLATLARRAWSLKRTLDTIEETSHAYVLPAALRARLADYDPVAIEAELSRIQIEIDSIAFDLYGFNEADRAAVQGTQGVANEGDAEDSADDEGDDEDSASPIDHTAGLLSWAVGVAFGRFDWRLATGERAAPAEPDPFDPLPAKSPGMLPDGAAPFHAHEGILVDDQGHPHDLARLVEEVLARVDVSVPEGVRRWLQRDFFPFHLQRYSKSRRKAPIYWPLSTTSGGYTLWVYYPSLTSQTLYTAINDFVEPKLKQVGDDVRALRNKGSARTRDDEKQFEALQAFELELIELRDTLLKLAPTYKPNHDDGVQISAAPLWPLFRHKPWQKVLKDTWTKLEKGDYDWAHLAMNYWPERVREKCKTDKSLAIAHGLEELYIEPEAKPKKARGKKNSEES
ncbi:type II restriction endonuclease subunit M [Accumulibacter sp.]|uniref:type II restriction endonuclease subunit M n=1 Tax=Accumulibacter sp. TaxID=2053492 RepID=UPI001AC21899|nr:type II restriction endonuclease subunit M [Accumulibacter sp.]MBN8451983.1 type II restriction endonuclease subunit M [Accumulibacter sp.]MBO3710954.1 type II restriction endonuclease subunit M [Accumulibacter sp.]